MEKRSAGSCAGRDASPKIAMGISCPELEKYGHKIRNFQAKATRERSVGAGIFTASKQADPTVETPL